MKRSRIQPDFGDLRGIGRLGSMRYTLGAGAAVQLAGAAAGLVTVPVIIAALGGSRFGVLVVIISLAPWLTLLDGALQPATRLLVSESAPRRANKASRTLLLQALRMVRWIVIANATTLALGLVVLPLVALFGARGVVSRAEIVASVIGFAAPVILSAPGSVYLGALEGVGRTVAAAVLSGAGPLLALPVTVAAVASGGGLALLCLIQGLAVAAPRAAAWAYWRLRPSESRQTGDSISASPALTRTTKRILVLALAGLVQTGIDPVIVSSRLGSMDAGVFGVANRVVGGALLPLAVVTPLLMANLARARALGWTSSSSLALRGLVVRFGVVGAVIALVIWTLGPLVGALLGAGEVAAPPILYAAAAAYVLTMFVNTPLYLAFAGPSGLRRSVRLNVGMTVLNVALSFLLVDLIGVSGPLWASAAAGVVASAVWLVTWQQHPEWLAQTTLDDLTEAQDAP